MRGGHGCRCGRGRDTHVAWAGSKHSDAADVSPTHNTQLAPWEALPNPTALCAGRPPRGADVSTHLHQALPCQPWGRLSRTLILMFIEHVKGKKNQFNNLSLQTAPGGCWANAAHRTSASPCAALCHCGARVGWGCVGCTWCIGCMGCTGLHGMNTMHGMHGVAWGAWAA